MGYVYILSNPTMPGLVKVGCTDRSPADRVAELSSSTGVPTPFVLELAVFLPNHTEVEQAIHQQLADYLVSGSREFFSVPVDVAFRQLALAKMESILAEVSELDEDTKAKFLTLLTKRFAQLIEIDALVNTLMLWDDESLIKLVESIFRKRNGVYRECMPRR